MPRSLDWFALAHLLAALWLAAGAFTWLVVRPATRRAGSLAERLFGLRLGWRLRIGFVLPGALVAGVTGLHLVAARPNGWSEGWVHVAFGLWALLVGLDALWLVPHLRRTERAAAAALEAGLPSAELTALTAARWPAWAAWASALAVVGLAALMVLGPR